MHTPCDCVRERSEQRGPSSTRAGVRDGASEREGDRERERECVEAREMESERAEQRSVHATMNHRPYIN